MKILAITACTAGIAHTYIAKEKLENAAKELGELAEKEEDILSYLAFPQTAISFFKNRKKEKEHCCPYMITQLSE